MKDIEKVARAMCKARYLEDELFKDEDMDEHIERSWKWHTGEAKAAIQALIDIRKKESEKEMGGESLFVVPWLENMLENSP